MTGPVTCCRRGRVLEITLDRPKANAIDAATSRALGEAFRELAEDDGLSVGIVTGAGERFFSAGWDLKAAAAGEAPDEDQGVGGFAGLTEYWSLKKPVIAAVNGMALGGGFELALAADLVVAADHAEFGLPEAGLGIVADSGGMIRLPKRLPRAIAMEMMFTGRRVGSAELASWGLINQVVPGPQLMEAAHELADRVAASAPLSLQAIKEVVCATEGATVEEGYRLMRSGALPVYAGVYASEDAAEGMAAFGERRAPVWKGR
ncbi:crotonobetainyl-CoA hydratase [Limibaculum sp. M0105]|uniref:Crotonobetainyl-CoA hydratase n=1 Tax=Thermohalobaculum xanthum TaxID=2753746 RepID=A0A8J7M7B3_9RHOB|nr:enoyl-CoA hydratase-related protein [Thermohalobaculum xanthum]MBK0399889.1 crotonobetainyl-CoA hydratase [Thermohalobaculum xanthum]